MKKIVITLVTLLSVSQVQAQFQTIDASYWCVSSIQTQTDSNGVNYTEVNIYNNDIAIDLGNNFIGIEALINGTDTIKPFNSNEHSCRWDNCNMDTLVAFRIDTTIAMSSITGILIRRAMPACGIMILESIVVDNNCETNTPLGNLPVKKNTISLFPNPTDGLIFIKGDQIEKGQLKVISMDGKVVMNETIMINSFVNLSLLSKGVYYLHINEQFAQKIILK